ncbi:TPA: HAD family hydrolase [bacterium]|nr:HAD family hydrolase [bacterium]
MRKIKALSFDMYRTLINTKDFHEQAVFEILTINNSNSIEPDKFHSRWDEIYDEVYLAIKEDKFLRLYDVSIESLRLTMKEFGIKGDPETGVELWLKKYEKAELFPEVEEVLDILSKRCPIIITSNVDNDDAGYAMLRQKNLPVIATITSEDSKSYKPDCKIFYDALSVLKCQPENVLHIGDSQTADVLGGNKAGMLTAWLNRPPFKKLRQGIPKPDYEISDLRELLDIVN